MKVLEFGDKNKRKIILIHGFQSCYQVWNKYIAHYEKEFHVIVPILPGHNPGAKDNFISFDETAKELEAYYIPRYGEKVYAVFGMSMGGALTATLLQNQKLHIEKVIFDGSPLVGINSIVSKMMLRFYLNITHKSQQRDKKTLEQAVKSIVSEENLDDFLQVLDNMSDTTIINCINNIAQYKLPGNIDTKGTKIYFYHGTATSEMLAKRTAIFISKHYPNSFVHCFNGKAHCENSLLHPELMMKELNRVLQ